VTDFPILQIEGASIPGQRLGNWLSMLLCNSWLRIPTVPTQHILLCFLSNEEYDERQSVEDSQRIRRVRRS
jgi:hypothetical protein